MQSELKPCAHCGGEAYIDDDTMGHSVVCCKNIECRAQGPFRPTDDEAIAAWNTRTSDAEITRLTEALRAAEEREKALREAGNPFVFAVTHCKAIGKRPHDLVLTSEFEALAAALKEQSV